MPVPASTPPSPDNAHAISADTTRATDSCAACDFPESRRAFVRHAALSTAAIFAALSIPRRSLLAFDIARPMTIARDGVMAKAVRYAIPAKDGIQLDRDNDVFIVRWLDSVYAFAVACPHQHTSLTWLQDDSRFQCPKHKSQYSPDGYFITGRATRGMDRYAITRDGDAIVIDLGTLFNENEQQDKWETAAVNLKPKKP